jgi:carbonic anhydrase
VDRIQPTLQRSRALGETKLDEVTARHVADTIEELLERSKVISDAVKTGKLAVVGANYKLELGDIHMVVSHGDL